MTQRLTIFLLLALALTVKAQVIDSSRLPPAGYWNPGVVATDGTTYRQNGQFEYPFTNWSGTIDITKPPYNAVSGTDCTTNIQFAIDNGQNNGNYKLYAPTGIYFIDHLTLGDSGYPFTPRHIMLYGDGPTNTFFKITGGANPGILASGGDLLVGGQQTVITNNLTNGTTLLHVQTWNSAFTTATLGMIWQDNSTCCTNNDAGAYTFGSTNLQAYENPARSQMFHIVGADASVQNITISPALDLSWSTNVVPIQFSVMSDSATIVGLESFSIQNVNGSTISSPTIDNIQFYALNNSWIRNVESRDATGYHIRLNRCAFCTVQGSYIHHYYPSAGFGGGNSDYGVDPINNSFGNLIINNHFDRCRHSLICEYGAAENVFAYNYVTSPIQQDQENFTALSQSELQHGGTHLNLWEGNYSPNLSWDVVLGGSTNNMAFRDAYTRYSVLQNETNVGWGIDIDFANPGAIVGCVVENPSLNGVISTPIMRFGGIDPNGNNPTNPASWGGSGSDQFPYPLNYTNLVNQNTSISYPAMPVEPAGTNLFLHGLVMLGTSGAPTATISWNATNDLNDYGNFHYIEYLTQTNTVLWTTTPSYSQTLPISLWLSPTVSPTFFSTNTFPATGPDVVGFTNTIVAMTAFYEFQDGSGGGGGNVQGAGGVALPYNVDPSGYGGVK